MGKTDLTFCCKDTYGMSAGSVAQRKDIMDDSVRKSNSERVEHSDVCRMGCQTGEFAWVRVSGLFRAAAHRRSSLLARTGSLRVSSFAKRTKLRRGNSPLHVRDCNSAPAVAQKGGHHQRAFRCGGGIASSYHTSVGLVVPHNPSAKKKSNQSGPKDSQAVDRSWTRCRPSQSVCVPGRVDRRMT